MIFYKYTDFIMFNDMQLSFAILFKLTYFVLLKYWRIQFR